MNSRFQKVKGHSNLMRDKRTGAILNMNRSEIDQARRVKQTKLKEQERIENLEKEMGEIKTLLAQIAEKL